MAGKGDDRSPKKNDEQPLLPQDKQVSPTDNVPWHRRRGFWGAVIGVPLGAAAAVVAAPLVVAGIGFGAGGIAGGSIAASMMSAAAAGGGGVAAGSLVAILQSIGAAGFGVTGLLGVGAAGAGVGAGLGAAVGVGADAVIDGIQNNGDAGDAGGNSESGSKGNEDSEAMDKVELIIKASSGDHHSFAMTWDEPLHRVFDKFCGTLGVTRGTVRFELNGVQLSGDNTLRMINWKIGDVVDAI